MQNLNSFFGFAFNDLKSLKLLSYYHLRILGIILLKTKMNGRNQSSRSWEKRVH